MGDFVKYTQTIQWQDSLLVMAELDSTTLRKQLDSVIAVRNKPVVGKKKRKRAASNSSGNSDSSNPFFQDAMGDGTDTGMDWYFSNQSAIGLGQTEFQRIWGTISLQDNWRRSNKATSVGDVKDQQVATEETAKEDVDGEKKEEKVEDAAAKIFQQLPYTPEQKKQSLAKIEEAYFKLGDLYYIQLNQKQDAHVLYEKLLSRFPETEYAPEVLYKLYLIAKENGNTDSERYAQSLKDKYPNSTFAKILINPNYLKETSVAVEKQKSIYKEAYTLFNQGKLRLSQDQINQAKAAGETSFTPQLELLEVLITGKTEDATRYQFELAEFIKKYPDHELKPYAENLLASSKSFLEKTEKAKGIRFVNSLDEPHYLVVVHKTEDKITDLLTQTLADFNNQSFKGKNLKTSNLKFNDIYSISFVSELADRTIAADYFDKMKAQLGKMPSFANHKFDIFVITKDNFQIFYRTKALDEYLTFFDRNYQTKNQ
ncbi:MAG TPA: tetratricopeptide repeat protein [Cyclobacteriaceae bacterium]